MRIAWLIISETKKGFLMFLLNARNLRQILNTLKKKMTLIAYVLSKLENANSVAT